ncbi:MAG TPA: DMT family transporter [Flavobacteriales bacterium]
MEKYIWVIVSFLAGAFLPIQAGINAKLGKAASSPAVASLLSFFVGLMALIVYVLVTQQNYSLKGLKEAPAYTWTGGLIGAFYVTIIILAFPRIGPGLTFGLVIAGQLLLSIIMEHYQLLGAHHHPVNIARVIGMLLIVAGVVLIKRN